MTRDSIGKTETKIYRLKAPLKLECGAVLEGVDIAYEKYGEGSGKEVILLCHALSGDAHAAGFHEGGKKPGWFNGIVGPGKSLDTEKYCVICTNVLGGCAGSTGPGSINPGTQKPYGREFPVITIKDMVHAQHQFLTENGINGLYAAVGGSMGGMQVLTWSVEYPDFVRKAAVIASCGCSTPMQIAFGAVQRAAILGSGRTGLSLARMMAHITYLSEDSMYKKFGRNFQDADERLFSFTPEFSVESYLKHQGESFAGRFDADSYLYITKAIDYYDLSKDGSLIKGLEPAKAKYLILSVTSDWLYPPELSKAVASSLSATGKEVTYAEIVSDKGHDGFLLEEEQVNYHLRRFLTPAVVSDLMRKDPPVICSCAKVEQAAEVMISCEVNHLPVVSLNGKLEGIVTSWDIAKSVAKHCENLSDIMTENVITVNPEQSLTDAAALLKTYHISALPVIENGRVSGMLTTEDITNSLGGS